MTHTPRETEVTRERFDIEYIQTPEEHKYIRNYRSVLDHHDAAYFIKHMNFEGNTFHDGEIYDTHKVLDEYCSMTWRKKKKLKLVNLILINFQVERLKHVLLFSSSQEKVDTSV